ncbi:MAG TPA: hypothetical protein VFO11_13290 [Candidatus Polarisedimenticolaceae bacterium]|nr:hypothetical protein [Candidatus Polarisedimenticolaceae bacterium]
MTKLRTTLLACSCAALAVTPGWARGPRLDPGPAPRVVVLPAQDLSGGTAPLEQVDRLVGSLLAHQRVEVVPTAQVLAFLDARRIRHMGGLLPADMQALRGDLQADVVIAVAAELFMPDPPPRVGLAAMAFSCPDGIPVGSAETVLAGEEKPGILGLRQVDDPAVLLERAVGRLVEELTSTGLVSGTTWEHRRPRGELRPAVTSMLPDAQIPERRPLRLAVLPFENGAELPSAGEIVAWQVLRALSGREGFQALDPGTVRASLLENRVIQDWGLSLPQADALRVGIDADLLVTGRVVQFSDGGPDSTPEVAFSLRVLDVRSRRVLWSSFGSNRGDDGVVLFDAGRYHSAHALSRDMAEAAVAAFLRDLERKPR